MASLPDPSAEQQAFLARRLTAAARVPPLQAQSLQRSAEELRLMPAAAAARSLQTGRPSMPRRPHWLRARRKLQERQQRREQQHPGLFQAAGAAPGSADADDSEDEGPSWTPELEAAQAAAAAAAAAAGAEDGSDSECDDELLGLSDGGDSDSEGEEEAGEEGGRWVRSDTGPLAVARALQARDQPHNVEAAVPYYVQLSVLEERASATALRRGERAFKGQVLRARLFEEAAGALAAAPPVRVRSMVGIAMLPYTWEALKASGAYVWEALMVADFDQTAGQLGLDIAMLPCTAGGGVDAVLAPKSSFRLMSCLMVSNAPVVCTPVNLKSSLGPQFHYEYERARVLAGEHLAPDQLFVASSWDGERITQRYNIPREWLVARLKTGGDRLHVSQLEDFKVTATQLCQAALDLHTAAAQKFTWQQLAAHGLAETLKPELVHLVQLADELAEHGYGLEASLPSNAAHDFVAIPPWAVLEAEDEEAEAAEQHEERQGEQQQDGQGEQQEGQQDGGGMLVLLSKVSRGQDKLAAGVRVSRSGDDVSCRIRLSSTCHRVKVHYVFGAFELALAWLPDGRPVVLSADYLLQQGLLGTTQLPFPRGTVQTIVFPYPRGGYNRSMDDAVDFRAPLGRLVDVMEMALAGRDGAYVCRQLGRRSVREEVQHDLLAAMCRAAGIPVIQVPPPPKPVGVSFLPSSNSFECLAMTCSLKIFTATSGCNGDLGELTRRRDEALLFTRHMMGLPFSFVPLNRPLAAYSGFLADLSRDVLVVLERLARRGLRFRLQTRSAHLALPPFVVTHRLDQPMDQSRRQVVRRAAVAQVAPVRAKRPRGPPGLVEELDSDVFLLEGVHPMQRAAMRRYLAAHPCTGNSTLRAAAASTPAPAPATAAVQRQRACRPTPGSSAQVGGKRRGDEEAENDAGASVKRHSSGTAAGQGGRSPLRQVQLPALAAASAAAPAPAPAATPQQQQQQQQHQEHGLVPAALAEAPPRPLAGRKLLQAAEGQAQPGRPPKLGELSLGQRIAWALAQAFPPPPPPAPAEPAQQAAAATAEAAWPGPGLPAWLPQKAPVAELQGRRLYLPAEGNRLDVPKEGMEVKELKQRVHGVVRELFPGKEHREKYKLLHKCIMHNLLAVGKRQGVPPQLYGVDDCRHIAAAWWHKHEAPQA